MIHVERAPPSLHKMGPGALSPGLQSGHTTGLPEASILLESPGKSSRANAPLDGAARDTDANTNAHAGAVAGTGAVTGAVTGTGAATGTVPTTGALRKSHSVAAAEPERPTLAGLPSSRPLPPRPSLAPSPSTMSADGWHFFPSSTSTTSIPEEEPHFPSSTSVGSHQGERSNSTTNSTTSTNGNALTGTWSGSGGLPGAGLGGGVPKAFPRTNSRSKSGSQSNSSTGGGSAASSASRSSNGAPALRAGRGFLVGHLSKFVSFGDLNLARDAQLWGALPGYEQFELKLEELEGRQQPFASGRLGRLYRAHLGPHEVALKIVRCAAPQEGEDSYKEDLRKLEAARRELLREVGTLARLSHPSIVQFHGVAERKDSSAAHMWCIAMEFMGGGTLRDAIKRRRGVAFPLETTLSLALDIARAMAYLHQEGTIHRDLKSPNILLDVSQAVAKVADFGTSREVEPMAEMTSETGTFRWMAPEMIRGEEYDNMVDVYSFGVVLWEILSLKFPWEELSCMQVAFKVAQKGERLGMPLGAPACLSKLVEQCWDNDPLARPEFADIVAGLEAARDALDEHPDLDGFELPRASSTHHRMGRNGSGGGNPMLGSRSKGGPGRSRSGSGGVSGSGSGSGSGRWVGIGLAGARSSSVNNSVSSIRSYSSAPSGFPFFHIRWREDSGASRSNGDSTHNSNSNHNSNSYPNTESCSITFEGGGGDGDAGGEVVTPGSAKGQNVFSKLKKGLERAVSGLTRAREFPRSTSNTDPKSGPQHPDREGAGEEVLVRSRTSYSAPVMVASRR